MGLFDSLIRDHEHDRHAGILGRIHRVAEQRHHHRITAAADRDGYMPPRDAAAAMSMTTEQVTELAAAGFLEYRPDGATIVIRPAVVSILAVRGDAR
jgi:hypothetical protein